MLARGTERGVCPIMAKTSHLHHTSVGSPKELLRITEQLSLPLTEFSFRTSRSSGPGGQNVNKLETRVELVFDLLQSSSLTDQQREIIRLDLAGRLGADGRIRISSQESRSQFKNKEIAIGKFVHLLQSALKPKRLRKATKPHRGAKEKRLHSKKRRSEQKRLRSGIAE
jgi:ribosome-associated protein